MTNNERIRSDSRQKIVETPDGWLSSAGSFDNTARLRQWFAEGAKFPSPEMEGVGIFVPQNRRKPVVLIYRDAYEFSPIAAGEKFAIGSGAEFARGAMAFGARADTAVRLAMQFDPGTGGKIDVVTCR